MKKTLQKAATAVSMAIAIATPVHALDFNTKACDSLPEDEAITCRIKNFSDTLDAFNRELKGAREILDKVEKTPTPEKPPVRAPAPAPGNQVG